MCLAEAAIATELFKPPQQPVPPNSPFKLPTFTSYTRLYCYREILADKKVWYINKDLPHLMHMYVCACLVSIKLQHYDNICT